MPSGLMQLALYGYDDIYLTGNPEITFFKAVYRKYTNFSIETHELSFDNSPGFGKSAVIKVPKIADLLHKMYLKITLPQWSFINPSISTTSNIAILYGQYGSVQVYMAEVFMACYNEIIVINNTTNISTLEKRTEITNTINNYYTSDPYLTYITNYNETLSQYVSLQGYITSTNLQTVNNQHLAETDLTLLMAYFEASYVASKIVVDLIFQIFSNGYKIFYTSTQRKELLPVYESNNYYSFAWNLKVGYDLIDYIDVRINGQLIDRQNGYWMNMWYELTRNAHIQDIYNKMIGDISDLTDFDSYGKDNYDIYVPLYFWFNKYSGLALPLVAMEFNDLEIIVKFKNIQEVAHINNGQLITIGNVSVPLSSIPSADLSFDINATLFADYIYLDDMERRKFAQSSHEYLIEQIQYLEIESNNLENSIDIPFFHPCKELVCVAQPKILQYNSSGGIICNHSSFGVYYKYADTGKVVEINPIQQMTITFDGQSRFDNFEMNFYNYAIPNSYHKATPEIGVNNMIFSEQPEEHQPSGTCNFSLIPKPILKIIFDDRLSQDSDGSTLYYTYVNNVLTPIEFPFIGTNTNSSMIIRIYAVNYNILRFVNGYAGLAFVSNTLS